MGGKLVCRCIGVVFSIWNELEREKDADGVFESRGSSVRGIVRGSALIRGAALWSLHCYAVIVFKSPRLCNATCMFQGNKSCKLKALLRFVDKRSIVNCFKRPWKK